MLVVGAARSTGDLLDWSDLKPMWNTGVYRSYSHLVESPEVVEHDGRWYLFYTTNSGHPISFQTTPDLLADTTAWSPQRRLWQVVRDRSTDPWFGIEFALHDTTDYLAACDPATLTPLESVSDRTVLLGAIRIGNVRLIDNLLVRRPAKRGRR